MSLLFQRRAPHDDGSGYPSPLAGGRFTTTTRRQALRHSVAWACTRLRADLLSTLPIDVYSRTSEGKRVSVPTPPILKNPSGESIDITEWLYDTQTDLDSCGNTFGLITERDGNDRPRRIDLVPRDEVTVRVRSGKTRYVIAGVEYEAEKVWHERQFTSSGLVVGLSPIAYAALSIAQNHSAAEFAADWFSGGAIPTGHLKYGDKVVPAKEADAIKARFRLAVENGDVFVHGKDWDYQVIEAQGAQASFLESMKATDVQICRYFGVPADLVDVSAEGSHITYANITQRNLQLLVMHLGPAIIRREHALTRLVTPPRYVKFNSNALLRMDPKTVAEMLGQKVQDRLMTPSEARALDDLEPFTPEQISEFKILWPDKTTSTEPTSRGVTS